jgi:translation initiation factor IF-3
MEIGKFLYREQKSHKHEKKTKSKEIGFHVNIAEHDLLTKMRHAAEFLTDHHQVTFKLQFRGRETVHKEIGIELLKRVEVHLKDVGTPDGSPKINGKLALLRFSPKRRNSP